MQFTLQEINSHSIASDCNKQSGIRFNAGAESDPSTGKVTYSKDGTSYTQTQVYEARPKRLSASVLCSDTPHEDINIVW